MKSFLEQMTADAPVLWGMAACGGMILFLVGVVRRQARRIAQREQARLRKIEKIRREDRQNAAARARDDYWQGKRREAVLARLEWKDAQRVARRLEDWPGGNSDN